MKKTKSLYIIFFVGTIFGSIIIEDAQSLRAPRIIVSSDRFGPVHIGMTLKQSAKALGVRVTRDAGYDENSCYYSSPKGAFKDIAFMMSNGRIVRIDINSKVYATDTIPD